MMGPRFKDETGKVFGHGTVISFAGITGDGNCLWNLKCDCGKEYQAKGYTLRAGIRLSCGHTRSESCSKGSWNKQHGDTKKRTWRIWNLMTQRCNNPKGSGYYKYGARGIFICPEWLHYPTFKKWALSNGYSDKLTIERKDNNDGYYPGNCIWATSKVQARNTRRNKILQFNGKSLCVSAWAEELGVGVSLIAARLRRGWTVESALTKPRIENRVAKQFRKNHK